MASVLETYYQNAQLAMAAYATLTESMTAVQYRDALKDRGFTDRQAEEFIRTYSIVSVSPPDLNGFSAVLFRKNDGSNERFLAIRGTNDPFDAFTDIVDIGLLGSTDIQAQYASLEAFYAQLKDELKLTPAQMLTVTGHSLGGFLAQTFTADHADVVSAYTYNAPGIGGSVLQVLEVLGVTPATLSFPNITNVVGQGPSLISGFGTYLGTVERAFIEGSLIDPLHNHSITPLTDALALYDLVAKVDPNVSVSDVTRILNAVSATRASSLETGLDALRKVFQGSMATTTPVGDREAYYTNLIALRNSLPVTSPYQVVSLVGQEATAGSLARNATPDGLAYRYALRELNPFAVIGADYSPHNANGALDLYDTATGEGTWTTLALSDRAELLAKRLQVNLNDGGPVQTDTHYVDVRTGFAVGSVASANEVIFGDDRVGDVLEGHAGGDHLYGLDGADTLIGNGGHDYMEGGAGNDPLLSGGAGNDIILGQQGDDTLDGGTDNDRLNGGLGDDRLEGGAGFDTYLYHSGQGQDTVADTDKVGTIVFDQQPLVGGFRRPADPEDTWQSLDGQYIYRKQGGDLVINNALTLKDFDFANGMLGLHLVTAPDTSAPAQPEITFENGFPTAVITGISERRNGVRNSFLI